MINHRKPPSLGRNALYNTIYQLLNAVFPLISASYIARVLAPAGVGTVAYAQNIVSYFVMLAALGIPSYGTREIARIREYPEQVNTLFSELILLNGICTAVCIAGYAILITGIFEKQIVLYAAVGLELFFNFLNMDWFYQGMEEYGYITARSLAIKAASLILLFIFVNDSQDCAVYALIHSIGVGLNYGINFLYIQKRIRLCWSGLNLKRHLKSIAWLVLVMVSASLYNKVDITMLGYLAGTESVAYYTNASKVIGIVLSLVTAISGVFLPRLSYTYFNQKEKYAAYITTGLKIVLMLAVPACIGMMLVAEDIIIAIFGPEFLLATKVLQVLSVFTIIKGAGDILCYQLIISSGNEQKLITSRICGGLANVVLNAIMIPYYGHVGAAVASVISELVVNGMMLPHALAVVKIRLEKTYLFSTALSVVGLIAAVFVLQCILDAGIIRLLVSVIAGIAVYGSVLLITHNELLCELLKKIHLHNQR